VRHTTYVYIALYADRQLYLVEYKNKTVFAQSDRLIKMTRDRHFIYVNLLQNDGSSSELSLQSLSVSHRYRELMQRRFFGQRD
jgi:hypothetical protein